MEKKNLLDFTDDPKIHQTIDSIIQDLCKEHESQDLEADIIALFEDIVQFFSGREEDFIDFASLPQDQKEAIYIEISTIIKILRNMELSEDKAATIKILSQNMISTFSKSARKSGIIKDKYNVMTPEEQKRIKEEFIKLTLNNLYKQKQAAKAPHHELKLTPEIARKYVQEFIEQGKKLSVDQSKTKSEKISPTNVKRSKNTEIKRGI